MQHQLTECVTQRIRMNDVGRGRHSPLPQFVLDVSLVEDVPLGVLHQEHDDGSAATTAVKPLTTSESFSVICPHLVVKSQIATSVKINTLRFLAAGVDFLFWMQMLIHDVHQPV